MTKPRPLVSFWPAGILAEVGPTLTVFELLVAALAAVQLASAFLWRRRVARPAPPRAAALPPVAVLTACKGRQHGIEENLRSLLAQDYPGFFEFVVVVPSRADPAFADLSALFARLGDSRGKLLVSDADPRTMSEQNENLLYGLARLGPGAEVVVFADADIRVGPGWLAALVGPLADPAVGCVSAPALYVPDGSGAGALRAAWIVHGLPFLAGLGYASGQSLAVRRGDFEAWGMRAVYARTINMDLTLRAAARRAGLRVETAVRELPLWIEPSELRSVLCGFTKWMLHFKLYGPLVWILGALATAAKAAVYLNAGAAPGAAAALAVVDAACAWLNADALEGTLGPRLRQAGLPAGRLALTAAAAAPFLPFVHALNLVVSAWTARLDWGGRRYRLRGPYDISVGDPPAAFGLRETAQVIVGGALMGASFCPGGPWPLLWVAFVPLLLILRRLDPWPAFLAGWAFGMAGWVTAAPWLAASVARFLDVPPLVGWGPAAAIHAWNGLMWGGTAAAGALLAPSLGRAWGGREDAALVAVFASAALIADAWFPLMFPVMLAGSQAGAPEAVQLAALGGAGLVAAWLLALNALAFAGLVSRGRRRAAAWGGFAALAAANMLGGRAALARFDARPAAGPVLKIGLVQTAFPHGLSFPVVDFHPGNLTELSRLTREAAAAGAQLVVWPESAYERFLEYRRARGLPSEVTLDGLPFAEAARRDFPAGTAVLANTVGTARVATARGTRRRVYNTAFLVRPDGTFGGLAEKRELVPFGEFMPPRLGVLRALSPRTFVFSSGPGTRTVEYAGVPLGPLICYEDLFPAAAWRYREAGAHLLVTLANGIWFTAGDAREEHLQFSRLRAVETGLPHVIVSNTGLSAFIDSAGRVVRRLGDGEAGTLVVEVPVGPPAPRPVPPQAVPSAAAALFAVLFALSRRGDRWET